MSIFRAIEENNLDRVKELSSIPDFDVNQKNGLCVYLASENGYLEILKYLVSIGADISIRGSDSMKKAEYWKHNETVKYLVEQGFETKKMEEERKYKEYLQSDEGKEMAEYYRTHRDEFD